MLVLFGSPRDQGRRGGSSFLPRSDFAALRVHSRLRPLVDSRGISSLPLCARVAGATAARLGEMASIRCSSDGRVASNRLEPSNDA